MNSIANTGLTPADYSISPVLDYQTPRRRAARRTDGLFWIAIAGLIFATLPFVGFAAQSIAILVTGAVMMFPSLAIGFICLFADSKRTRFVGLSSMLVNAAVVLSIWWSFTSDWCC